MLRFLQSIFGGNGSGGRYPKSLVKGALERAVDGTDPWIRAVSGYRKKLLPAVVGAIDHVVAQVAAMTEPIALDPSRYDNDPLLRTFFISASEVRSFVDGDAPLAEFRRGQKEIGSVVHALLVMEKREKQLLGVAVSGDIVMRDIAQTSVTFERHRLVDLSWQEEETRRLVKRRAYDHLLKLALRRLTTMKTQRGRLEKHRELLRSKLQLLQREGWGFDKGRSGGQRDVAAVEGELERIEKELLAVGGDDRMLEAYLAVVADVLGHPGEYLWGKKEKLIVDRMGIKRGVAASDAPEVTLDMIYNAEGRSLAVSLVTVPSGTG